MRYVVLFVFLTILLLAIILFSIAFKFYSEAVKKNNKSALKLFEKKGFNYENRVIKPNIQWLREQKLKDHYITSKDGLKLHGVFLQAPNPLRTVICVHGYRGNYEYDFSPIVRYFNSNHTNMFFVEQRAHGDSEGDNITFGAKEKEDLQQWIEYVQKNVDSKNPLYLYGISMGASTCLLSLENDYQNILSGVIADCGFTSMRNLFNNLSKDWFGMPGVPLVGIVGTYCKLFAKFDMEETSTKKALANNKVPVLFIHGEADTFINPEHTRVNYTRDVGPKDILWVAGANHGESLMKDPERYHQKLEYFFSTYK